MTFLSPWAWQPVIQLFFVGGGGGGGERGKISSSNRYRFIGGRHNFRLKAVFQGVELAI